MKRRNFITLISGATISWSAITLAQASDRVRRVSIMVPLPAKDAVFRRNFDSFVSALTRAGWIEGRTVEYAIHSVLDSGESYDKVAQGIGAQAPDVIVAITETSLAAIKRQVSAIPVVFVIAVGDPVAGGYVASISQPGGNITGITDLNPSLIGKHLQLLKEISPEVARIGILYGPDDASFAANMSYLPTAVEVAKKNALMLTSLVVHNDREIDSALAKFASEPSGGLMVAPYSIFAAAHRHAIIEAAARYHLPAIYSLGFYATGGGLISYSADQPEEMRQAAYLVDRILQGAKPANLPVQTPNTYRLVINHKTAQALGLKLSPDLLSTADEVIE